MVTSSASTKKTKKIKVSPGTKGSISEHIASAWLMSQGYDVFRNVSPNGRADLIAIHWERDETIRVDVKSSGFTLDDADTSERAEQARLREHDNHGFKISYLVVSDDWQCEWYTYGGEEVAANDNKQVGPRYWMDKQSGVTFITPGNHMTNKQWTFFCHWLLRAHKDLVGKFSMKFVDNMSYRYTLPFDPSINSEEKKILERLFKSVYTSLVYAGGVEMREEFES